MTDRFTHVTDKDFEDIVIQSDIPVLVDFWAVWCGPCAMVVPALENIAESYKSKLKIVKVNVDENMAISSKYGIMSIPTLLLFKGGEVKETIIGAVPQARIEEKLKGYL